jgi:hypothetical protein
MGRFTKCFTMVVMISALSPLSVLAQSSRERAVMQCVVRAQQQIPASGNLTDPDYNHMYNVYAGCMRELGENP